MGDGQSNDEELLADFRQLLGAVAEATGKEALACVATDLTNRWTAEISTITERLSASERNLVPAANNLRAAIREYDKNILQTLTSLDGVLASEAEHLRKHFEGLQKTQRAQFDDIRAKYADGHTASMAQIAEIMKKGQILQGAIGKTEGILRGEHRGISRELVIHRWMIVGALGLALINLGFLLAPVFSTWLRR
jgi:ERCC4-type nuclease